MPRSCAVPSFSPVRHYRPASRTRRFAPQQRRPPGSRFRRRGERLACGTRLASSNTNIRSIRRPHTAEGEKSMSVKELRESPMMDHLLSALERGEDVGHFGRLTFAMIGRHFLDPEELVSWLAKDHRCDEGEAKALAQQVAAHDYSP